VDDILIDKKIIRQNAKAILLVYGICIPIFLAIALLPFNLPSIREQIGFVCPLCGMTRAFFLATRLDFLCAISMNLLFLPLTIFAITYFIGAAIDFVLQKNILGKINFVLFRKPMIAPIVALIIAAWVRNYFLHA